MTSIWVEGKEDVELVLALLQDLGLGGPHVKVKDIGGWSCLPMARNELAKTTNAGGINLIVFDADRPATGGGATARRAQIAAELTTLQLTATVFLLPDDQSDGTVEDLMLSMIPPGHRQVDDVLRRLRGVRRGARPPQPGESYAVGFAKTRTYAYVEAMPLTADQKKRRKSYRGTKFFDDATLWDLRVPRAHPLRTFLQAHVV